MGWVGPLTPVVLLTAIGTGVGLSGSGWLVGSFSVVLIGVMVAGGLLRSAHELGPADFVTLTRAWLACGVAALVGDAFVGQPSSKLLVGLTVVALVLDAVDGWVARRTRTSGFGARMDGEVDAFLILVLSVFVARSWGPWVLTIGAMRYLFAVAGWVLPWMRRQLPPRYWRKVVTAVQGVGLTVAAAGVLPAVAGYAVLVGALGMLTESFARDVLWLWRRRGIELPEPVRRGARPTAAPVRGTRAAT